MNPEGCGRAPEIPQWVGGGGGGGGGLGKLRFRGEEAQGQAEYSHLGCQGASLRWAMVRRV